MRRLVKFFFFFGAVWILFAAQARADVLGQNQAFFIDKNYDSRGNTNLSATLRFSSNRAYFYVENNYWDNLAQDARDRISNKINLLEQEFDNRIYPMETSFFGSEPNPGIDNDPRLTILLTPLRENVGGYFDTTNEYIQKDTPDSNQREMLYVNLAMFNDAEPKRIYTFIAHEFQHLITFNQKDILQKATDDIWTNEMRSEYAITLLGYNDPFEGSNLQQRLSSFLANPQDSMTEWKNLDSDYGSVNLFGEYLAEHWSSQVIADTLKVGGVGIGSIDAALARNGFDEKFIDVFRSWLAANIINNTGLSQKLGYTRDGLKNFHVNPTKLLSGLDDYNTFAVGDLIKDWQGNWYDIANFTTGQKPVLKIVFSSRSLTSFSIVYAVFRNNGIGSMAFFDPNQNANSIYVNGIGNDVNRVVIMPFKKDRVSGFGNNETLVSLAFTIDRVSAVPSETNVVPSPISDTLPSPTPQVTLPTPTPSTSKPITPEMFGLMDGDFIRVEGDINVYIINGFGYKRLILSPTVCSFYSNLGRDCRLAKIKLVSPITRDVFKTSWFVKNASPRDGRVYDMVPEGNDFAILHHLNMSGDNFIQEGGDFRSVFSINSLEQNFYRRGIDFYSLAQAPNF